MRNQLKATSFPVANDKRMEVLLRKEMMEHQSIISSHHKEMQDLRDSLSLAMQRFDALYEQSQRQMKERDNELGLEISKLQEKVKTQQITIEEQKKFILSLYNDVHDIYSIYSTKSDLENHKKEICLIISEITKNYLSSFQDLQKGLSSMFQDLETDVSNLKSEVIFILNKATQENEKKFHDLKMDKDGVLKQIKSCNQSTHVIEKKIENIYTLIERINKRGIECHKQAQ